MKLGDVIDALYESEINCSVSTFWDGGYRVRLGDDINGYKYDAYVSSSAKAAELLDREARRLYPNSSYAVGAEECARRQKLRNLRN